MTELVLKDLSKTFRSGKATTVRAVESVDLEVRAGELMVLVGPSGCGKSTLLRLIAGLEEATTGTVFIGGRDVTAVTPKDRDVAMVFQNYALFPHLTVYENMALGLRFRKVPKNEIRERVTEAAELLHLGDVLARKPKALSGGQRQRTALGRALVRRPRVFLLDEPLSNLDAKLRAQMRAELAKIHRHFGATMIFVTHDQVEAMTLGDRICVMNQGRIRQVGAPLEVYQDPQDMFVAGFLGSPGMNLLRGVVSRREERWFFGEDHPEGKGLRLELTPSHFPSAANCLGQPMVLGVRPEAIRVVPRDASATDDGGGEAKVEVCEAMGHESLLYLHTGGHLLVARVEGQSRFAPGQSVWVRCSTDEAHLFDAATEAVLVP